jgi:hypothetical protein
LIVFHRGVVARIASAASQAEQGRGGDIGDHGFGGDLKVRDVAVSHPEVDTGHCLLSLTLRALAFNHKTLFCLVFDSISRIT